MNILVVKLSSMGDIVLATPSIRALRMRWSGARIIVAINREFVPLLKAHPAIDGLVVREKTPKIRRLITLRQAAWFGLTNHFPRFDLAIDLQGTFHSAAWTYFSGARNMAGFGGSRPGWRFSVPLSHVRHAVDANAAIVERLGAPVKDRRPTLHLDSMDEEFVTDFLHRQMLPQRGFLIVHPFTAWRSKEWPIERYAAVIRQVMSRNPELRILFTGSEAEALRARRLAALVGRPGAVPVAGELTLGQSLALWSRARLYLGGDTGALHASAAFGVPVVALFGPTLPEVTGPLGDQHRVIQASRPAMHHAYRQPGAERHVLEITEPMVIEALDEMLL